MGRVHPLTSNLAQTGTNCALVPAFLFPRILLYYFSTCSQFAQKHIFQNTLNLTCLNLVDNFLDKEEKEIK